MAANVGDESMPPTADRFALQRGPVSGRYEGVGISDGTRASFLELRLDIDTRYSADSPVMNRVSGDLFDLPGGTPPAEPAYVESWIVDSPTVTRSADEIVVAGTVRYWRRTANPPVTVRITVPSTGPVTVEFATGTTTASYRCDYRSDAFRETVFELDYAASVNVAPHVPAYDTHGHATRPGDISRRTLTIESAYREAGIGVRIDPERTVIDDSAAGFTRWSAAELHDAMAAAFSAYGDRWPAWSLWGMQAGTFESPDVGGVMFDAAADFGGAGRAPERQGFAVFRDHEWFRDLVTGAPGSPAQAAAMRHFLYTWVHEAGHAFNLLHSWDKSRPRALSWMNYDWRYDRITGPDRFWSDFRFRFDDEELLHLRHGDRAAVVFGGDPWATGEHWESPPTPGVPSNRSLELLLRAPAYFSFMEPVEIEFRLRNPLPVPQTVDTRLEPHYGTTSVLVRTPDGRTVRFRPVMCLYGRPVTQVLAPAGNAEECPDRYSALVPLTFGRDGFVFDQPGRYLLRATYSDGVRQTVSNTLAVRIGQPATREQDRFAADFFDPRVGLALTFGGSMSPFLASGMRTLTEAADRFADQDFGTKAAVTLAKSVGSDFFARTIADGDDRMVRRHRADPAAALAITEPGLRRYRDATEPTTSIGYNELVALRANLHIANGDPGLAARELTTLADDLSHRGVNPTVLRDIRAKAQAVRDRR
ncbi:hypothetical protein [Nocardia sp. NPDC050406]|uniref:hypothetical protein n=1 Tax=Nocardia sp. NPDC050406 TaxID=3364318 RepID=UPI0037970E93